MRNIPLGNGAISIAHPGHELRLYGFLQKAKPFIFLLTDGTSRNNPCRREHTRALLPPSYNERKESFFDLADYSKPEGEGRNIRDAHIYTELLAGRLYFFEYYTKFMAGLFVQKKIDYVVADASEGQHVIHEMCRIMTDTAIRLVKKTTGKTIVNYEYSVTRPYNEGLTEDCIHVELDDETYNGKINAVANYHPSILSELKPNLTLDLNVILQLREMPKGMGEVKNILKHVNPDFFRNEYIRPYIYKEHEKPFYETNGEKLVSDGKYAEVIYYEKHIKPIKEQLDAIQ